MSVLDSSSVVAVNQSFDAATLISSLRNTFNQGRTQSASWRLHQLKQMRAMLCDHWDEFVEAVSADSGRPSFEAWTGDLAMSLGEIDAALNGLKNWMKPRRAKAPATVMLGSAWIMPEPLGVGLVIAPWNYPFELALNPVIGAIAAGNCVAIKPSELAPKTSAALAKRIPEYMDTEGIAVVEGGIPETEALLAEKLDHIFYTGNGHVARIVLAAAAPHLTPVVLELGGKSPCIVAHDANIDVTARRICHGKFYNAGQTCIAPDYVLVDERVKNTLIDRMKLAVEQFYGMEPKQSPDFGRIANDRHHARLAGLLEEQAVVVGGQVDARERYIAPTIVRDSPPESAVMQEEIFGPILPVIGVSDLDTAVSFVNSRPKPLALYVFTENRNTEKDLLTRVTAGGACVNSVMIHGTSPDLPFGGVGESGMGRYHGRSSFEVYSHFKTVVRHSTKLDLPLVYPPYSKIKMAVVKKLI